LSCAVQTACARNGCFSVTDLYDCFMCVAGAKVQSW